MRSWLPESLEADWRPQIPYRSVRPNNCRIPFLSFFTHLPYSYGPNILSSNSPDFLKDPIPLITPVIIEHRVAKEELAPQRHNPRPERIRKKVPLRIDVETRKSPASSSQRTGSKSKRQRTSVEPESRLKSSNSEQEEEEEEEELSDRPRRLPVPNANSQSAVSEDGDPTRSPTAVTVGSVSSPPPSASSQPASSHMFPISTSPTEAVRFPYSVYPPRMYQQIPTSPYSALAGALGPSPVFPFPARRRHSAGEVTPSPSSRPRSFAIPSNSSLELTHNVTPILVPPAEYPVVPSWGGGPITDSFEYELAYYQLYPS